MNAPEWLANTVTDEDRQGFARQRAPAEAVEAMLFAKEGDDDGRSEWYFIRLPNGDLVFATYPHGDTYFATEQWRQI